MKKSDYIAYGSLVILTIISGVLMFFNKDTLAFLSLIITVFIIGIYLIRTRFYFGSLRIRLLENIEYSKAANRGSSELSLKIDSLHDVIIQYIDTSISTQNDVIEVRIRSLEESLISSIERSASSNSRRVRDQVVHERNHVTGRLERVFREKLAENHQHVVDVSLQQGNRLSAENDEAIKMLTSTLQDNLTVCLQSTESASRRIRNQIVATERILSEQLRLDFTTLASNVKNARQESLSLQVSNFRRIQSLVDAFRSNFDQSMAGLPSHENLREIVSSTMQTPELSQLVANALKSSVLADETHLAVQSSLSRLDEISKNDVDQTNEIHSLINKTEKLSLALEKGFEDSLRQQHKETSKLTKIAWDETRQVGAYAQLLPSISPRWALPPLGGWALDARSMLHLAMIVEEHQPKTIVELGSGTSTIWLGYMVERYGGKVHSFDHLEKYRKESEQFVFKHGLQDSVSVDLAPLREYEIDGTGYPWYGSPVLDGIDSIDLLLVDGPPASTGAFARYPALPLLINKLHKNSIVLLDDSDREQESQIIDRWSREFTGMKRSDEGVSRLAVLDGFIK